MTKVAASKEKVNYMHPITAHFNNHTAHVSFNNPLEQVIISLYLILSLSSGPVLSHLTESSIIATSEINLYVIASPLLRIQGRFFFIYVNTCIYICAHILLFFYLLI